jgi:hypothetical protein
MHQALAWPRVAVSCRGLIAIPYSRLRPIAAKLSGIDVVPLTALAMLGVPPPRLPLDGEAATAPRGTRGGAGCTQPSVGYPGSPRPLAGLRAGPDPTQTLGTPPPHGGYPAARLGVLGPPPGAGSRPN